MKITISAIKADVGSHGGHFAPHQKMIELAKIKINEEKKIGRIIDGLVVHTGDDIALIMSHHHGVGSELIHMFAWDVFKLTTETAQGLGVYAAGQDLLVDAPSGNIRGAGPGVAELEFELLPDYRPAETFLVIAADKCSPSAFNVQLWNTLCHPGYTCGLNLSPKLHAGFFVDVIDMDAKADRLITFKLPEEAWDFQAVLGDMDRFAVETARLAYNNEPMLSVSATRLHNIAGKYTGKDDPIMVFRTQGIFPAPEEIIEPYKICPYVTGDCRGSNVRALMPKPINSAVTGGYANPIVSCIAFSMDGFGRFSHMMKDIFSGSEWDYYREKANIKSAYMAEQSAFGVARASQAELAYTGIMEIMKKLDPRFVIRNK
ncbi:MAG: fructose 1,6-bisphosphatase [Candidatus Brennerbacteria bacterium]|nr:fructose 1,6-bisphosphatase [Candidatus Brennerbacteria bacterium]